jgi:hypothetical protein
MPAVHVQARPSTYTRRSLVFTLHPASAPEPAEHVAVGKGVLVVIASVLMVPCGGDRLCQLLGLPPDPVVLVAAPEVNRHGGRREVVPKSMRRSYLVIEQVRILACAALTRGVCSYQGRDTYGAA